MTGRVGRYTRNLVLALQRFGVEISVACNEREDGDFSGLDALNKENSDVLLNIVKELKPDLVHVQLEHGLYGLNFGPAKNFHMQTNIDNFYELCQLANHYDLSFSLSDETMDKISPARSS